MKIINRSLFISTMVIFLGSTNLEYLHSCPADSYGYTYVDSVSGAVPFINFDISGTGTLVLSGGSGSAPISLSPSFEVYGAAYDQVVMSENGYLSTDPTDLGLDSLNDCCLPVAPTIGSGARFYVLHDDLSTPAGYHQYFPHIQGCPRISDRPTTSNGCHVFFWQAAEHTSGGGSFNMWAILYDNKDIVFQIGAGNPEHGSGSTTGIQNNAATSGLTAQCNTPLSVPDNYVLLIEAPISACNGVCGDCDGDNFVSILDAHLAARHAAGLIPVPTQQRACCDVSNPTAQEEVTINDALEVARSVVGLQSISCR